MRDQLELIFGNCKFQEICSCIHKTAFEDVLEKVFYVYDEGGNSQKPVRVVTEDQNYQLTVYNDLNDSICLVKTDKCLLEDDVSKCDCIVSNKQIIYLVEIKSASAGSRGKRRKEAIDQLEETIDLLKSKGISFDSYKTTALVCFKSIEPRITQASRNSAQAIFREKHGIALEEGNVINF